MARFYFLDLVNRLDKMLLCADWSERIGDGFHRQAVHFEADFGFGHAVRQY